MTNPVEILISQTAPHRCIVCRVEGSLLCGICRLDAFSLPPSRCYRCHKATRQNLVCEKCHKSTGLKHVWVASEYETIAKKLIHKLKFDRANKAADSVAEAINEALPDLPNSVILTHVPTANKRVRIRGYDQAKLIARSLAKMRNWQYEEILIRLGSSRQVGASRSVRVNQLDGAFKAKVQLKGEHILLIDDVLTTGATIQAVAKELKKAGAKTVDTAVFTQPIS